MRAAADALAARWAAAPPAHPVIVAGSTGSRAPTRAFMAAVARLPQGALVLPGLDPGLPPAVWDRLAEGEPGAADHPQHGFRRLAEALGFDPGAVPAWHPAAPPNPARNALVSLALRPAPVTDQWRAEGGALRAVARRRRRGPDLDRGARPEARGAGDRAPAARGGRDTAPAPRSSPRTGRWPAASPPSSTAGA